jgi:C-terminal processing protease CtpA/Prc/predicted Zn-dependent protease
LALILAACAMPAAAAQEPAPPETAPSPAGKPAPKPADKTSGDAAGEGVPAEAPDAAARQKEAERAAVTSLVQQGNQARQEGRLDDAVEAYRSAASLDPRRYEIRILIADTLRRAGRPGDSMRAYQAAVKLEPRRAPGYTGQAILRRSNYDYEGAAGVVEAALPGSHGRDRADLLVTLGETRRRQGRLDDARAQFSAALEEDPDCATAHAGLARVAEERGDLDAAVAAWDRYLALEADDHAIAMRRQELMEMRASIAALAAAAESATTDRARGETFSELGRLRAVASDATGAAAAWRAALKTNADKAAWRRGLALSLEASGDRDGAASEFRRVLKGVPDDGIALYHLAALARRSGDARGEESAWTLLVTRRPDDLYGARALAAYVLRAGTGTGAGTGARERVLVTLLPSAAGARVRALLEADAGEWEAVETALETALLVDASDPWTLDVLSDLLARRPDMLGRLAARAQAAIKAAAPKPAGAVAPADPTAALLLLARCHLLAGHDDPARAIVDRVIAARPGSAQALSTLGEIVQAHARSPQEAIDAFGRAVVADPKRPAAHVDLALALLRAGRPAEAEKAARQGLQGHPRSAPLLSLLGAARADQNDAEGAARAFAEALTSDPADNFHLARSQYPLVLASLGRTLEARRALQGLLPEFGDLAYLEAWTFARDSYRDHDALGEGFLQARDEVRRLWDRPFDAPAAHRAIADLLAGLDDPYTRLRDPDETAAVWLTRHSGRPETDALGHNRPAGQTVVADTLPGGLGYVQIANFTDPNAVGDVRRALQDLGKKEGLVLDLRGNGGGLTRSADAVADMLLGPGVEVGAETGPEGFVERVTRGDGALTDQPITVLVDGQTASAAERLASGLQASGRATVVGTPTYGKGIFQTSRILPGGHTVLVSTGESLQPGGRPIQGRGVRPEPKAPAEKTPVAPKPPEQN